VEGENVDDVGADRGVSKISGVCRAESAGIQDLVSQRQGSISQTQGPVHNRWRMSQPVVEGHERVPARFGRGASEKLAAQLLLVTVLLVPCTRNHPSVCFLDILT
jgi:hypothetical protein